MFPRRLRSGLLPGAISLVVTLTLSWTLSDAQTPKRGGTLRVSYGNEISNLDFYTAPGYDLSTTTAAWNHSRHTDTKVDDYYVRYARELDPTKRKAIAKEFAEYSADKLYWNTISGSPFYMVSQPWMKGYVYNAEF